MRWLMLDDHIYNAERIKENVNLICFFEDRYEGTFEEVVKIKGDPYQSSDWQWCREGKEWRFHLKEIGDL